MSTQLTHVKRIGFQKFRIELHLPFLRLRTKASVEADHKVTQKSQQYWIELSFLQQSSDCSSSTVNVLMKCQCSVVISGVDENKWVGYAFGEVQGIDARNDDQADWAGDGDHLSDDDSDEDEQEGPVDDLFVSGGSCSGFDNGDVIWDPRTYFLRTAAARVDAVRQEYAYLVQRLDGGVKDWVSALQQFVKDHVYTDQVTYQMTVNVHERYDQNEREGHRAEDVLSALIQQRQILRDMQTHLSSVTYALDNFLGPHGDHAFFADLNNWHAQNAFESLDLSFESLRLLERRVTFLREQCDDAARNVSLVSQLWL